MVSLHLLRSLSFVRKFAALKVFKRWCWNARKDAYNRKRAALAKAWILGKPAFAETIKSAASVWTQLVQPMNQLKELVFFDNRHNFVYGRRTLGGSTFVEQSRRKAEQSAKERK